MADRVSRIVVEHKLYPLERVSVYLDYCMQKRLSRIENDSDGDMDLVRNRGRQRKKGKTSLVEIVSSR